MRDIVKKGSICTTVLGILIGTYAAWRIGDKIDWAVKYVDGLYQAPYTYVMEGEKATRQQLSPEDQQEIEYLEDTLYIGLTGGALFLAGIGGVLVTRERIGAPLPGTHYDTIKPKKGTKERPYEIRI